MPAVVSPLDLLRPSQSRLMKGLVHIVGEIVVHTLDEERRNDSNPRKRQGSQEHQSKSKGICLLCAHLHSVQHAAVHTSNCLQGRLGAVGNGCE